METTLSSRRHFLQTGLALGALELLPVGAYVVRDELVTPATWLIGCYTRPWDQFEYRVALDAIAEAGYRYAGIMTAKGKSWVIITPATMPEEAAKIGEEVRKRGLKTLSVFGDFSVAESLEKAIQELRRLIDNCAACNCPNLLLGGTSEQKYYQPYYQAIAENCDYALSKAVSLSIKPHGGLNATGPQCRQAIEHVNRRNFGLWYDPGNIFYYSDGALDPVKDSATVDGLVAGMSIKDFRLPKDVLVTPGTGQVKFPEVLANLHRGGFRSGPLVVECLERAELPRITAAAKEARLLLEGLTGSLGK